MSVRDSREKLNVGVATMLLLGAAGGMVRVAIHAYDCMLNWREARSLHRSSPEASEEGPPSFSDYYDPLADSVAALFHVAMGAGAAWGLGATNQINGGFALFAAGASAPALFVQLANSRLAEQVLGAPQAQPAAGEPPPGTPAAQPPPQAAQPPPPAAQPSALVSPRPGRGARRDPSAQQEGSA